MKKVVISFILVTLGLVIFSINQVTKMIETVFPENGNEFSVLQLDEGYKTIVVDQKTVINLSTDDLALSYAPPESPEYLRLIRLNNDVIVIKAALHQNH